MTAPASYSRVLAALKRLSPSFPSTDDDKAVGKELGSIATAIGTAYDRLDAIPDEMFPDTATETIDRWEKITRVPTRTGDAIADRRQRVLNVFRRSSGPRIDQLEKMLSGPLALDTDEIIFIEMLRQYIDDALLIEDSTNRTVTDVAPGILDIRKPWPGVVDDFGVKVYLSLDPLAADHATVTSPDGTVWTFYTQPSGAWYRNRTDFLGKPAGGKWTITVYGTSISATWASSKLLVSNDVDSSQIYNFFAFCDPALSSTPDLVEAQRLFHRTTLGHLRAFVIQSMAFTVGSGYSLVGRDPVGV